MKKIVFVSIFVAFLMISISFVSPVQVQAAETEARDIWEETTDLALDLYQDEELLDFIKSDEVKDLINEYKDGKITYKQYIFRFGELSDYSYFEEKYAHISDLLENKWINYFSNIKDKYEQETTLNEDVTAEKYLCIYEENNEYKIKKQNSKESSDGLIIKFSDSIYLKDEDGDWEDIKEKLKEIAITFFCVVWLVSWTLMELSFYAFMWNFYKSCTDTDCPIEEHREYYVKTIFYLIMSFLFLMLGYFCMDVLDYLGFNLRYHTFEGFANSFESSRKVMGRITLSDRIKNFLHTRFSIFIKLLQSHNLNPLKI